MNTLAAQIVQNRANFTAEKNANDARRIAQNCFDNNDSTLENAMSTIRLSLVKATLLEYTADESTKTGVAVFQCHEARDVENYGTATFKQTFFIEEKVCHVQWFQLT